jgi:hypothetical protein
MRRAPQFYRVRFADRKVLGEWTIRVLHILASGQTIGAEAPTAHPVILVPLRVPRRGVVCGYVNESARRLVRGLVRGVRLDGTAKSAAELPDGLTLLRADAAEAEVYEYRVSRARESG